VSKLASIPLTFPLAGMAYDRSKTNRVRHVRGNDRDGGCSLSHYDSRLCVAGDHNVGLEPNQLVGESRSARHVAMPIAVTCAILLSACFRERVAIRIGGGCALDGFSDFRFIHSARSGGHLQHRRVLALVEPVSSTIFPFGNPARRDAHLAHSR